MDKNKIIVAAVATVAIVVAIVMIFVDIFGEGAVITPEEANLTLRCTDPDCGEVFVRTLAEMGKDAMSVGDVMVRRRIGAPGGLGYTCAKCGRRTAFKAWKCPQCGEWFVPEVYFIPEAKNRKPGCPACGYSIRARRRGA
jgi:predicted RNA-binding Zn-ribbon protein involved in translation (DUF1610 family)